MYLVDAGPVLKFFATNNERWFFAALARNPIHAPEAVRDEVYSVPHRKPQFERAPRVWDKVAPRFIRLLSDAPTPDLERASRDIFRQELESIQRQPKDLGERMAVLHASLGAQAGADVVILCDDQGAQELIRRESQRLRRLQAPGSLAVVDTLDVLTWAVESKGISDKKALRAGYARMAALDSSLPHDIQTTKLLESPPW